MGDVEIVSLNSKGEGVLQGSGETAPFALPGDRITDGKLVPVSTLRQTPVCKHFEQCGGCSLQHASDDFVARWKTDLVRRALNAHGLDTTFRDISTSAPGTRRRAVFSGRRTKKTTQVGFHARRSDQLVPITECHVIDPAILAILPTLQALTRLGASRSSLLRLNVTCCLQGLDIAVTDAKELDIPALSEVVQLASNAAIQRLSWNDEVLVREPALQQFGNARVEPPPGAFLQATPDGEQDLLRAVQEVVDGAKTVVDLFAGCGTFSLPLAENAEIHCVEGSGDMLSALDQGWRQAQGLKKVTCETRDLFRRPLLDSEFKPFDAVVIDPPRAGAPAQTAQIAQSQIAKVAFVSCNPVSFARDAKTLCDAGFALDWVQVVDQFRWSHHVELAAQFTR